MKKNIVYLLPALCALLLASCVSPIAKRIEHNPQIYNDLPESQKRLVATGQISEGMSKQAVFLAWGNPNRKSGGSRQGTKTERWSYAGYDAVHSTSLGYGYGYGGGYHGYGHPYYHDIGIYYQPTVTYLPFERKWAEFTNSRVSAWAITP
ncbi:hypothetical protein FEM03_10350 [Phragmitibacter flavus]|uniref:Lipoprotein n=1 Tax=Phragmitibacter flavus TaxID=2576071 RepID=A0A5R8KEG9_9BACT|nr:hypothetical protein [Phragmitibacter flavus]TLD70704.1 hypothetical protein FEM03_10350 [Phragmitibacter flavus]